MSSGCKALHFQGIPQRRNPLDGEHFLELGVLLISEAGVDKNILSPCTNEQAIESQRNAVLLIRLAAFLPQHLWDHTEHGPAVQPKPAVRHRLYLKPPKFHFSHSPKLDCVGGAERASSHPPTLRSRQDGVHFPLAEHSATCLRFAERELVTRCIGAGGVAWEPGGAERRAAESAGLQRRNAAITRVAANGRRSPRAGLARRSEHGWAARDRTREIRRHNTTGSL